MSASSHHLSSRPHCHSAFCSLLFSPYTLWKSTLGVCKGLGRASPSSQPQVDPELSSSRTHLRLHAVSFSALLLPCLESKHSCHSTRQSWLWVWPAASGWVLDICHGTLNRDSALPRRQVQRFLVPVSGAKTRYFIYCPPPQVLPLRDTCDSRCSNGL